MTNNKTIKEIKENAYLILEALINSMIHFQGKVPEEELSRLKESCLFTCKVATSLAIERAYEEGKNSRDE